MSFDIAVPAAVRGNYYLRKKKRGGKAPQYIAERAQIYAQVIRDIEHFNHDKAVPQYNGLYGRRNGETLPLAPCIRFFLPSFLTPY